MRRLALEVIDAAARNFAAGLGPDDRLDFEAVIVERWPGGRGPVGIAQARTARAVRQSIADYYGAPYG